MLPTTANRDHIHQAQNTNRMPPRPTAGCHITMKVKDCSEPYLLEDDKGLGLEGATLEWNEVVKVEEKGNQNFYGQLIPPEE